MKRLIILIGLAFALTGCSSSTFVPIVKTNSTTFQGQEHFERGTVSVLPFDNTQEGSLEFQAVSNYLLKK